MKILKKGKMRDQVQKPKKRNMISFRLSSPRNTTHAKVPISTAKCISERIAQHISALPSMPHKLKYAGMIQLNTKKNGMYFFITRISPFVHQCCYHVHPYNSLAALYSLNQASCEHTPRIAKDNSLGRAFRHIWLFLSASISSMAAAPRHLHALCL